MVRSANWNIDGLAKNWSLVPVIGWVTGLGTLLFFWRGAVPFIAPVEIFERQTSVPSLRRAWVLSRRLFWRMVTLLLTLFLFLVLGVYVPTVSLGIPISEFLVDGLGLPASGNLIEVVFALVAITSALIYLPVEIVATCLMYLDVRIRTEGLDLTSPEAGLSLLPMVDAKEMFGPVPQPGHGRQFLKELVNFILFSFAGLGAILAALLLLLLALFLVANFGMRQ